MENWTSEQKQVIDLHDRNILVSAAAGSGKTAVLVERIIKMITRQDNPIDIDRLVVVTFTNMAAYEMRMRIMSAIQKRLEEDPDNRHLERQLTLVHGAKITTIDSFCLDIVRSYFNEANLDPAFRVADEGELKLLSAEVLEELLEDYYARQDEEFYHFVDCFAPQKTDAKIEDYILKLYRFSQSNPWPAQWLEECLHLYECADSREFCETQAVSELMKYIRNICKALVANVGYVRELCEEEDGPSAYLDVIGAECDMAEKLALLEDFDEIRKFVCAYRFERLPSKKDPLADPDKRETAKKLRDEYKKIFENLKKDALSLSMEEMYEQTMRCKSSAKILIELTMDYMNRMEQKKREKKIINFSDMEHIALNILIHKENGEYVYSNAADELAERYDEILIDEYQDSNMVQEAILNSISRERFGKNNVFMVGDVKQSIYKFRLARPELFVEKYNRYTAQESECQKIELHRNFRSRGSVLAGVNEIFFRIMAPELGGVRYDDNAMLNEGAQFPEKGYEESNTEICLLEYEDNNEYTEVEAQAQMVTDKIIRLVNGTDGRKVYDKALAAYRTPRPGDIVVLFRSLKGYADTFAEVMGEQGLAAYSESSSGYFNTMEIAALLSMLAVIDNPRQDIPLAAVMKSYFGNMENNEIAQIRGQNREVPLYDALIAAENDKVEKMLARIREYRELAKYLEISRLIWKLAYDTGFYDYLGGMPGGRLRQENVNILIEKARQYEKTSYKGLFHFLRYIEKLKTYEIDFAGASASDEDAEVVRLMSIHKSKGLEFPIVIVAGMNKNFNMMDSKDGIIFEPDLGVGMDDIDIDLHTKRTTVVKKIISRKINLDNLAEEQRILYVALTRAKEHLILAGSVKNRGKALEKWNTMAYKESLSFIDRIEMKNYLDMVMPVALRREGREFLINCPTADEAAQFADSFYTKKEQIPETDSLEEETKEFAYPHKVYDIPVKMSVSEIKHMGMEQDNEDAWQPYAEEETELIPDFMREEKALRPALRGTAYHCVLEHLDYEHCGNVGAIKEQMDELCRRNLLSEELRKCIRASDILAFTKSSVGRGAAEAFRQGKLFREKQFMTGIRAREIFDNADTDDMVVVQGVIDMYYETGEGIVLVDYKTDRVAEDESGERELISRYREQLLQYKKAIEMISDKKVVQIWIYSFCLQKEVKITN